MSSSLSSYWVKFFTAAGFPHDVATKHAVVFSNNRIKPDMLPDLDKPSLKEMGITLMGDMIAILRYAKKVTEEMTCERFLVDTEGPKLPSKLASNVKSIPKKTGGKFSSVGMLKADQGIKSVASRNSLKTLKASSSTSSSLALKKKLVVSSPRVVTPLKKVSAAETVVNQRNMLEDIDSDEDESDDNEIQIQKRLKIAAVDGNKVNYKVIMNKSSSLRSTEARDSSSISKKISDQKRTVFDRLGDSSVTSTTNFNDNSTIFNVTGIGTDVVKRNSSVFNRLGDRDLKKDVTAGILKNGNSPGGPQGILRSKSAGDFRSTTVKVMKLNPTARKADTAKTGTMHADHEGRKRISTGVKQLVRTTKALKLNHAAAITRKIANNKLASERVSYLPAKSRLGIGSVKHQQKQVTFNKIATVAHIKKPGVFSRLGI